jgi:hypothetical protein
MDVGEGTLARVLDLETLIAINEELVGEKDRAVCRSGAGRSRRRGKGDDLAGAIYGLHWAVPGTGCGFPAGQ